MLEDYREGHLSSEKGCDQPEEGHMASRARSLALDHCSVHEVVVCKVDFWGPEGLQRCPGAVLMGKIMKAKVTQT